MKTKRAGKNEHTQIQLSEHFDYPKLFRFVLPSIMMMIFTSVYGIVDGFFISNYTGKIPFAAVNLIMPFIMILGTVGFMLGTGGSAIVAKTMGEDKPDLANKYFSLLVYMTIIAGIVIIILGNIFLIPVAKLLGATEETLPYCVLYARISFCSLPFFMLQNLFQTFLVTAERPKLGFKITLVAGCTNMILDFLLVGVFKWGVAGAALATAMSELAGGGIPLIYFFTKNDSRLRLVRTGINLRMIGKACFNGSSELMSNIAMSVVSMVYNWQLLKYAGEDGVAAYGVIMYAGFIFAAIFIGYSVGVAPVAGFNYGAGNTEELHNVFSKSLKVMAAAGVLMMLCSLCFAKYLAAIFVGYDEELLELTATGFRLYNLVIIFTGFNIYGSSFFTSLENGLISALISFLRTFVFQIAALILLPLIFGINGIWFASVVAEICSLCITATFLIKKRGQYHY